MTLHINGDPHQVPTGLTVATLLLHLGIDARRVAVELNESVVKRMRYEGTPLAEGDRVEIVNFVGGG